MSRTVHCSRLDRDAEGLERPPFPGSEGQRIFDNVSKEAWAEWLKMQTMLINEHRLTPFEAEAKAFLAKEREKYLFQRETNNPEGYVPPKPG